MGQAVNEIIIHKRNGSVRYKLNSYAKLCTIKSAEQKRELLGEDNVTLKIESAEPLQCAVGDYIECFGSVYTLNRAGEPEKKGERMHEQSLVFEGLQYKLLDAQFRNADAGGYNPTATFNLVADMHTAMELLIRNVNRVAASIGEYWELGECPTTEYKDLAFNNQNCLNVLQELCEEFKIEFQIVQSGIKRYTLRILKAGSALPAIFDYSKQSGVVKIKRKNVNTNNIITRLYVEGGTRNIGSKYRQGSERLRLDGESYVEDRDAIAVYGIKEGSKTYEEIFPHRDGEVTAIVEGNKLQFTDTAMFDLNAKDSKGNTLYLIEGTSAKVKFSGNSNLAGYEFEVHDYNTRTHTFTLVPYEDKRGLKLPNDNGAYSIRKGDTYQLLDIIMPQDPYVTDAEGELQQQGGKDLAEESQPKVEYEIDINPMSLEHNYGTDAAIVNIFEVGDFLHLKDADINVDKSIRIKGFTRDCYSNPYKYKLTLSDITDISIIERLVEDSMEHSEIIRINDLTNVAKARANWRTTQELLHMVFDNEGYFDTENIKPASIETLMLSVGSRAGQFVIRNLVIAANVTAGAGPSPNIVEVSTMGTAQLIHYALEETDRTWLCSRGSKTTLTDTGAYYIYARCPKDGRDFNIIFSQLKQSVESGSHYYFLVGVLSSVFQGYREVTLTYGATRITGRTINCGRIESIDKSTYFDLDAGEIGGNIKFKNNAGSLQDIKDLETALDGASSALDGLTAQVGAHSTGIDNLTQQVGSHNNDINNLQNADKIMQQGIDDVGTSLTEMEAYINGQSQSLQEISALVDELKNQADNTIEYWYGAGAPTLKNYPFNEWKDDKERKLHIGDMYTDTTSGLEYKFKGVSALTPAGERWSWSWVEVATTGVGAAIKAAQEAMSLAGTKCHVYITSDEKHYPTADYQVGDLWVILATLKMRYCVTDSDGIAFKVEHWKNAGYTDDTKANEALRGLASLADDSVITPAEKLQLETQMMQLSADYAVIVAQAEALNVDVGALEAVYTTLTAYIKSILADMSTTTTVNRTYYNKQFETYYSKRAKVLEACNNSKNKVYVTTSANDLPEPTYRKGDIWLMLDTCKVRLCKISCSGTFKLSDWVDAGYTNDDAANKALQELLDMADDTLITPAEKLQLKDELSNLKADFTATAANGTAAGCDTNALEEAFRELSLYVTPLLVEMDKTSSIIRDEFNAKFSKYYEERAKLIDAVAQKKVDMLEIGQGNYIANGAHFKSWKGWQIKCSSKLFYSDSVMGSSMRINKSTQYQHTFMLYTGFGNADGNIMLPDNQFREGQVYTLAFWVKCPTTIALKVGIMTPTGHSVIAPYENFYTTPNWKRITYTFKATGENQADTRLYISTVMEAAAFSDLMFTKFVLVEGNKAPEWVDNTAEYLAQLQSNIDTLKAITDNYTQISGGLILSTFIKLGAILKDGVYQESAGFKAMYEKIEEVAAYFGGTYADALAGKAPFIVYHNGRFKATDADITGTVHATDGEFAGELKGVTGSFKKLVALDEKGKIGCALRFGQQGMQVEDGDLYHQGNHPKGRDLRFYTQNVRCRGTFGTRLYNVMTITDTICRYYHEGFYNNVYYEENMPLHKHQTERLFYYAKVNLWCTKAEAAGFAAEIVLINDQYNERNYVLQAEPGKKVTIVNINNSFSNVYIIANGKQVRVPAGTAQDWLYVGSSNMMPAASGLGAGWLMLSQYTNRW